MHFQTYSHTGANSTNTGGIAKTQWTVPEIGNVLFSFVGPVLLSSLSDSQRASFLFTHKCIISIIRVEAVNSPCLQIFQTWWGTALKKSALADSAFTTEVGLDLQRSMSTSAILWFCRKKSGKRNHESWSLSWQESYCYLWDHMCWILLWYASLHSILAGHCWCFKAHFPTPCCVPNSFFALHLTTRTSENLIPWSMP